MLLVALAIGAVVWLLYTVGQDARPAGTEANNDPPVAEQEQREPEDNPPPEDPDQNNPPPEEPREDAEPRQQPQQQSQQNEAENRPPPPEEPASQPETLQMEVRLNGNTATWLQIWVDGQVFYADVAQPGFVQNIQADDSISINTANADAVNVVINGQDYGTLGGPGEVVTREFALKDAT